MQGRSWSHGELNTAKFNYWHIVYCTSIFGLPHADFMYAMCAIMNGSEIIGADISND